MHLYWNIHDVSFTCPFCGKQATDNLQTHLSAPPRDRTVTDLAVGDYVPEFAGETITLFDEDEDEINQSIIGACPACGNWVDFTVTIVDGFIKSAQPLDYVLGEDVTDQALRKGNS